MQMFEGKGGGHLGASYHHAPNGCSSLVCFSPLLLMDGFSRKSISYSKLPQQPLCLSVLKLDGTSFEIEVAKNGTVAELKQAVEAAFRHLHNVSWSHVWGNFCLCYDGQKLLTDDDALGLYGMKDGDQLQFVRHLSINYNLRRACAERRVPDSDIEKSIISDVEQGGLRNHVESHYQEENIEGWDFSEGDSDGTEEGHDEVSVTCDYRLARYFRGWFSYRKLSSSDLNSEQRSDSSKLSNSFLGSFKNSVRLYSNKYDSGQRETSKAK